MGLVWFVGVSTGGSLVHRAIPLWRRLVGDLRVEGRDLALGAAAGDYRRLLLEMSEGEDLAGAVVTSHKVGLYSAGADLFSSLDEAAVATGEVNAIRRNAEGLHGFARDPVSVGRVVDRIWRTGDHVVCLGAGGTALALGRHLLGRDPRPHLHVVDQRDGATEHLRSILGDGVSTEVGTGPWDDLVEAAPDGALVVNATGMGKDRAGSPVSDSVVFPHRATVWELNYRGQLRFLELARRDAVERGLDVHGGWSLFNHGWAAALTPLLGLTDDPRLGERFASATEAIRPR